MTSVFVDTSAFYAVLDADADNHSTAGRIWHNLISAHQEMLCSNYVLVETLALLQRRLGIQAACVFQAAILPVVQVRWVDELLHPAGVAAMLTAGRRQLGVVDYTSFEIMRRTGVMDAFAFDLVFDAQGFRCLR